MIETDLNTLIANKYYNRTATHSVNDNWTEALRVAEEIKQLFVEQACEIADQCNYNSSEHRMPDTRTAYNVGIDDFMQAIRDKFK